MALLWGSAPSPFDSGVARIERVLSELNAKVVGASLIADVPIFHNAGRMAMIEQGVARGQDLLVGRSPWTTQTALRLHGYISALDGSVHPMTMAQIPYASTPKEFAPIPKTSPNTTSFYLTTLAAPDGSQKSTAKHAFSLFGVGKHQTAKRRYSADGGAGSQRAVVVFGFERGSDSIAVSAVGMWKSGLWAIS